MFLQSSVLLALILCCLIKLHMQKELEGAFTNCQLMSLNRVNIQLMRSDTRVKKMMILELVMISHQAGTNFQHHN
jgi:hypothetical protein